MNLAIRGIDANLCPEPRRNPPPSRRPFHRPRRAGRRTAAALSPALAFRYHVLSDMPRGKKPAAKPHGNGANLGFEPTLWAAADKLRNNMDAAEYRSEEHTSELQSLRHLVCRLLLEKKKKEKIRN